MGFDLGDLARLGKKVVKHAPLVGTVLGGSGGGMIGDLLAGAFGVDSDSPNAITALEQKILGNEEALTALKQFEMNHKLELEKIGLQETQAHLADVASARSREVEIVKATGSRDYFLYGLACLYTTGFFVCIVFLMFRTLPDDSTGVIFMLFGTLSTVTGMVAQYFFGSSMGSLKKTGLLHQIANRNGNGNGKA